MMRRLIVALACVVCVARPACAQDPYNLTAPVTNLATIFTDLFGPRGLIVDSLATLPGRAAALGALQQRLPVQLQPVQHRARQPAGQRAAAVAGRRLHLSVRRSLGVFQRTTQSFGPILADRADTIGAERVAFGFAYQRFTFDSVEGIDLQQGARRLHARQRRAARRPPGRRDDD